MDSLVRARLKLNDILCELTDALGWKQCDKDVKAYRTASQAIFDVLATAIDEARLEEAKWWHMQRGHHGKNWCCERIDVLEALRERGKV